MKKEFKVDRILKKIKVLEGIVEENVLHYNQLKYSDAYDKYSLFKTTKEPPPLLQQSSASQIIEKKF